MQKTFPTEDVKKNFASLRQYLGFTNNNFIFINNGDDKFKDFPVRLQSALKEKLQIDAVYVFNNKPIVLFKTFDGNFSEDTINNFRRNIWSLNEAPIAFVVLPCEIRIYNAFVFSENRESGLLKVINSNSKERDLKYLGEFSSINFDSGKIWQVIGDKLNKRNRVDQKLLENLKAARDLLKDEGLNYRTIHSLLGRCIFSRYLIDRAAIAEDFFQQEFSVKTFSELILRKEDLYKFFTWLAGHFNGDMFPIEREEKDSIKKNHLKILNRLFKGDEIKTGQQSLFQYYNFDIIPVELISNIYETFLTQEDPSSKRKSGIFYTPLFLVDFILSNSLDNIIEKKGHYNVSILDPACGSGVFLVESFRRMVEKYIQKKGGRIPKKALKEIVYKNIYGIDKSLDAIRIAVFSLYIAMLDYIEPKDLEKNGFDFPRLIYNENDENSGENFFAADFFKSEEAFNTKKVFKESKFELILGNPPWGTPEGKNHYYERYCDDNEIPISDRQVAQAFLFRVKDFAKENTEISLIVTSKILYNLNALNLRSIFLKTFMVSTILEFSTVRKIIFQEAIGPGVVIFYKKAINKEIENNEITYYALKSSVFSEKLRIIAAEGWEVKKIAQKYFINYDYLWKIMLYGNTLDFYFIERLKNDFPNVSDVIEQHNLISGVGLQVGGGDENDATELIGMPYLDTRKKMLKRYYISLHNVENWKKKIVHRVRNVELYKAPHLLIKKGLTNDMKLVSAFSNKDLVFTDSVTSIKGSNKDKDLLKNLSGILNSDLFRYYIFMIGSSTGIEREQGHNENERFTFPVVYDSAISQKVNQIQKLYLKEEKNYWKGSFDNEISKLENELNRIVYRLYSATDTEKDLIDYALEISIPLFNNKKEPLEPPTNDQLKGYAEIFIDTYEGIFEKQGKFFQAEIYTGGEYFIAMNFKVLNNRPDTYIIHKRERDTDNIIKLLGSFSFSKISQGLYIQRAIIGVEQDSFYIIKPNERKSWHRANARHDLNKFMAAMWDSELRRKGE